MLGRVFDQPDGVWFGSPNLRRIVCQRSWGAKGKSVPDNGTVQHLPRQSCKTVADTMILIEMVRYPCQLRNKPLSEDDTPSHPIGLIVAGFGYPRLNRKPRSSGSACAVIACYCVTVVVIVTPLWPWPITRASVQQRPSG